VPDLHDPLKIMILMSNFYFILYIHSTFLNINKENIVTIELIFNYDIGICNFRYIISFYNFYSSQYYYRYFTRPNTLPGPFPLPVFGNVHQQRGSEFNDWLMTLHKKYGDIFEIYLAGKRTIVLCNTELIENMNVPSTKTRYLISYRIWD
jgi:hypothetical protein